MALTCENPLLLGGFPGVELEGFEPSTPCMPCKCSAELSYSPREMGIVAGRASTPGGFSIRYRRLLSRSTGPWRR